MKNIKLGYREGCATNSESFSFGSSSRLGVSGASCQQQQQQQQQQQPGSSLATHFDIAVVRCLFISQWREEGVFWATTYLDKRFVLFKSLKLSKIIIFVKSS